MTDTQTRLTGPLEPWRSEDDFDLQVVGRIPDALAGAYYRIGPNPQFDPQGPYFPFLGDGMIHYPLNTILSKPGSPPERQH